MIENKKASIILILKILEKYSDENHFLTQQQIIDLVYSKYGIQLERKSVSYSISLLQELDYDINKNPKGGYALFSRQFDESEIRFMVDALFSSKSISGKEAKRLCSKISDCLSIYDRKSYDYLVKSSDVNRTTNKQVFYNVEIINEAIKRKKWIGFKYLTFDKDGKQVTKFNNYVYHASPCYLVNNFGRYYLLAYRYKYDSVNTWRLDYMVDMYIMEEREMIDSHTLKEFRKYRDISEYINDHIYMFGGESIVATVRLHEPNSISYVNDWFGNNATIYTENGNLMAKIKCNETAFFYWIMQYGEHMTMISPQSMIDWVKRAASAILEEYNKAE